MNSTFIIIVIGALFAVIVYLLTRPRQGGQDVALRMVMDQINELSRTVDTKIGETTKHMSNSVFTQLSESQKMMQSISEQMTRELVNVTRGMSESQETSKQVLGIADDLRNLEKVLKHQKQRGALGEASLELILSNILPPGAYKIQHRFLSGEVVDAVIVTKDGLIPVDAKYSLDNYNRMTQSNTPSEKESLEKDFTNDLKKRIDETSKYIKPEEGTLPFAFMFIPAEGIYYDLLVNEVAGGKASARSLVDYAYNDRKVIIVSPTTFAAYLQSVLYGFRAFKIEESAKDIIKKVEALGNHISAYQEFMKALGNTLGTAVNHYNKANKELMKIDKDVLKITGTSPGVEDLVIEKPEREE
jgi:DNA recombination protein RmuC